MTDQELNLCILRQLYAAAELVWAKMDKLAQGSFTAKQVLQGLSSGRTPQKFSFGTNDMDEVYTAMAGEFQCKCTARSIFQLIDGFEALTQIGSKRKHFQHVSNAAAVGSVTFSVNKDMAELCAYVMTAAEEKRLTEAELRIQKRFMYIGIDTKNSALYATDGYTLHPHPVKITECSGNTERMYLDAKALRQMCSKMERGKEYTITATIDKRGVTTAELNGAVSTVDFPTLPNVEANGVRWRDVFNRSAVADELAIHIGKAWRSMRSFFAHHKEDFVEIKGQQGSDIITLSTDSDTRQFVIKSPVQYSFCLHTLGKVWARLAKADTVYLGKALGKPMYVFCDGHIHSALCGTLVREGAFIGDPTGKSVRDVECNISIADSLETYMQGETAPKSGVEAEAATNEATEAANVVTAVEEASATASPSAYVEVECAQPSCADTATAHETQKATAQKASHLMPPYQKNHACDTSCLTPMIQTVSCPWNKSYHARDTSCIMPMIQSGIQTASLLRPQDFCKSPRADVRTPLSFACSVRWGTRPGSRADIVPCGASPPPPHSYTL